MLYFSYAANLNRSHMARLCPGAEPLYPAVLKDHILTLRHWFNVERGEGGMVQGGVWKISRKHLVSLDDYEDSPELYGRRRVEVVPAGPGSLGAWGQASAECRVQSAERKNSRIGVSGYRRIEEKDQVTVNRANKLECLLYVMKEPLALPFSPPDRGYLQMVREGYEEWGILAKQIEDALREVPGVWF